MVTFVGMAARLVTRAIPMATIAVIKRAKLKPVKKVAMTVIGVKAQPCAANAIPTHNSRFRSCDWQKAINFVHKEGWATDAL